MNQTESWTISDLFQTRFNNWIKEWLVRESCLASSDSKQLIENMHDLIYCTSIPLTLKRIYRIYWKGFISDITGTRAPKGSSDAHAFYLVYLSSFKSNRNVVLQLSVVQSSPLITCSYMPFIKSSSIESWTAFAQRTLHVSFHMTHQVLFDASDLICGTRLLLIPTSCVLHLLVMPSGNTAGLWPTWNNTMKSSKEIF